MLRLLLLILTPLLLISLSCAREWQDPNIAVPSRELPISSILEQPIIYDSAGITVEGMVWHLNYDILLNEEIELPFTTFKLADRDGNYINVYAEGNYPLIEGEQVRVTGIYRRALITEYHNFINEIEARTITLETTSRLYKIYRYIR